MKKAISLLSALMLLTTVQNVVEAQELTVSDIEYIDEGSNQEYPMIILTKEGSALNVHLMNYSAHPDTEEFVITSMMNGGSNGEPCSVSIGVADINYSETAVITTFNISFNVHGIENSSFYLSCWWFEGQVTLTEGEPLELWENKNISKDGVIYTLDNKTKTATLNNGRFVEGEYNIPSELDYGGQTFNLTSINYPAFAYNTSLISVIIPKGITDIGAAAFYRCSNLTDLYCYAENVPTTGVNVFNESPIASATLHVPAGSLEKYKTTSPWSDFGYIAALPMKDISRYFSYFVVTPESHHETMNLWYQWKKYVATDGKEYLQYGGYFGEDSIVDAMVLLRQEEAKCFCYDTNTNTEHLLFDFGLQKGDSYYDDLNNTEFEVTDVRDTIVNNESLCLIELMNQDGKHDIWLEGCGSIYTGILKANASYRDVYLLRAGEIRFYPNNQFVKTADANVTELVWEGKLETPEDREAYEAWYGAPSNLNAEFVDDTLHVWGRLHTTCDILAYAICSIKNNSIDFQLYSNGEVDCYNNYEIDAQIPGFQRGSYEVQLYNKTVQLECMGAVDPVTYTEGQMATIILPEAPDASKGKYYRLDRIEEGKIIFEQELHPQAHIPYIIVPSEDFSIDLSTLDLQGLQSDTVSVDGISFIGSYVSKTFGYQEGFYIEIIDTTPDCRYDESCVIGALRAYLLVHWDDPYNQGGTKVPPLERLEIVLLDYGTSIDEIKNEQLKIKNDVFDLQGRQLLNKPAQGLYIENGRKKTAK